MDLVLYILILEDSVDLPDTGMHQNPSANDNFIDKETAKVSKPVDDMFADEDDLPGTF